jgi:WD40 repeat protein
MALFNFHSPIECLYQIQHSKSNTRDITISPDNQIIATTDGIDVKLWNLQTGELLRILNTRGPGGLILSIAISPNGQMLAAACEEYAVHVWNVHSGEHLRVFEYITEFQHEFRGVAFFSDNVTVIAGGTRIVEMWDTRTGKRLPSPLIGSGNHLALSPNNHLIGSALDSVEMVEIPHTKVFHEMQLPDIAGAVAISPDGLVCAAGLRNGTIKLWQWKTFAERTIQAHSSTIKSLAFTSDGQTLLSGSWDKSIKFWNVQTGKLEGTISENLDEVSRIALSTDNRILVTKDSGNITKVWRLN